MPKTSAGMLMYRWKDGECEVLLGHPGGPLWQNRDTGAWSIPKGEFSADEDPLAAARREFAEETGIEPTGLVIPLTPIVQRGGKTVHAWAFEGDCDPGTVRSNTFEMEWPPRSGTMQRFPELDRVAWLSFQLAREKINVGQIPLLDELAAHLGLA